MHVTRQQKEKFLAEFSEEDFRDKVVRRLFHALGFTDGRDLCGPQEAGKDAIFRETDRFGDIDLIALQTKVGSITLAADPKKNLHEVVTQLRTALLHPYACSKAKKKYLPHKVFLAASGVINDRARDYICSEVNDPRVKFLDRDEIIDLVDQKCPEIWAGIVAEVTPYFNALAARVDQLSVSLRDVNPIHSSVGAFAAAGDDRFVDLKLGARRVVAKKRLGKIYEDIDFTETSGEKLFQGATIRALILGEAGTGKTTLLIRLAYLLAKSGSVASKAYKVPIFVRANELIGTDKRSIFETLSRYVVENFGLDAAPFSLEDFDAGRIVLLVDGLDELSKDSDRQEVVDFLLEFTRQYATCSLALTTRPYSSIDRLRGLQTFSRYRVSPLSFQDAAKLLKKFERDDGGSAEWRQETLRKLAGLHGLDLNPLLVTVFAVSAKVDKKDVPANITELFAKFTELLLGRWDERKGFAQQYQSKLKEELLAEFSFDLHRDGRSSFKRSEFTSFISQRLGEMGKSVDCNLLVGEILDRSGLLRGDDDLEFRHHLIQEYFAGKGIADANFVRDNLSDDWWRNAIVFYFGGKPKAVDELLDAATRSNNSSSDSFIVVGLALQACYMSRIEEKLEVWKWVNGAAVNSLREFQKSLEGEKYPISTFMAGYLEARDSFALSGIEDEVNGIGEWAIRVGQMDEAHAFWYAVGLSELGEFVRLEKYISNCGLGDTMLLAALHLGCFYAGAVRELSPKEDAAVKRVLDRLGPIVAVHQKQIIGEMKGQLLEYRNGGVVALDAEGEIQSELNERESESSFHAEEGARDN